MTDDEKARIVELYEHGKTFDYIEHTLHRGHRVIKRTLLEAGVTLRPVGRQAYPRDPTLPLHQPHVAYCGMCDRKALYVFTTGSDSSAGGALNDGGHILELDPHPTGRWVDRGDGLYQRIRKPPADGSGRRSHDCRRNPG